MTKRILLALIPWALSIPALMLSLSMAFGAGLETFDLLFPALETQPAAPDKGPVEVAATAMVALSVPYAWLALLVMTIAWIRQKRLAPWWPHTGTALALLAILAFGVALGPFGAVMAVFYSAPGIVLAVLLRRFHLYPLTPIARTPEAVEPDHA